MRTRMYRLQRGLLAASLLFWGGCPDRVEMEEDLRADLMGADLRPVGMPPIFKEDFADLTRWKSSSCNEEGTKKWTVVDAAMESKPGAMAGDKDNVLSSNGFPPGGAIQKCSILSSEINVGSERQRLIIRFSHRLDLPDMRKGQASLSLVEAIENDPNLAVFTFYMDDTWHEDHFVVSLPQRTDPDIKIKFELSTSANDSKVQGWRIDDLVIEKVP